MSPNRGWGTKSPEAQEAKHGQSKGATNKARQGQCHGVPRISKNPNISLARDSMSEWGWKGPTGAEQPENPPQGGGAVLIQVAGTASLLSPSLG